MNVLSISSNVVYGRVGNRVIVPALHRLGHEPWPVNTVSFSNHPGHGTYTGEVRPAFEIGDLVDGLDRLNLFPSCHAVLSGYLGGAATARHVAEAVALMRTNTADGVFCLDPVMGEGGRLFVDKAIPDAVNDRLIPLADIVTPNTYELGLLTGRTIDSEDAAIAAARALQPGLRSRGAGLVVVTGGHARNTVSEAPTVTVAVGRDAAWRVETPYLPVPGYGAGDLFSAVFLGVYLNAHNVPGALSHAVACCHDVLARTQAQRSSELALTARLNEIAEPPAIAEAEHLA